MKSYFIYKTFAFKVWGDTQLTKCLPCKHWVGSPVSTQKARHDSVWKGRCESTHPRCCRGWDWQLPGAPWPGHLAKWRHFLLMRDPHLGRKNDIWGWTLCMYAYTYMCFYIQMNTHTTQLLDLAYFLPIHMERNFFSVLCNLLNGVLNSLCWSWKTAGF